MSTAGKHASSSRCGMSRADDDRDMYAVLVAINYETCMAYDFYASSFTGSYKKLM